MKTIFKYILLFALGMQINSLWALPTGWAVNSGDYQYSLTLTATVIMNGEAFGASGDAMAAFVNNECRGVAEAVLLETNNTYYFYLTVFSNNYSGDTIHFSYYINDENRIVDFTQQIVFTDGDNLGSVSSPFILTKGTEAEYNIMLNPDTLAENLPTQTFVGKLQALKNNVAVQYSFSLLNQKDYFTVKHDSLLSNISFNYENKNEYNLKVVAYNSDSTEYFTDSIVVKIIDVFESVEIMLSNNSIAENSDSNRFIGNFTMNIPNIKGQYTLTIDSVLDFSCFNLVNDSLFADTIFNYEIKNLYSIQMLAIGEENDTLKQVFYIDVLDVNDAAYIEITNDSIKENAPIGSFIGRVFCTDEDVADIYTLQLSENEETDNKLFTMQNDSLFTAAIFNFEAINGYNIELNAIDSKEDTLVKNVVINIIDTNDAPYGILLSNDTISENIPAGAFVAKLIALDEDATDSFVFELINSEQTGTIAFNLEGHSLITAMSFDYETTPLQQVSATVTDLAGESFKGNLVIHINNVIENNIMQEPGTLALNCYPNPTSNWLTIESNEPLTSVCMYNVTGKLIAIFNTVNSKTFNVSSFPKGVYIIEAKTKQTQIIGKFIKE